MSIIKYTDVQLCKRETDKTLPFNKNTAWRTVREVITMEIKHVSVIKIKNTFYGLFCLI